MKISSLCAQSAYTKSLIPEDVQAFDRVVIHVNQYMASVFLDAQSKDDPMTCPFPVDETYPLIRIEQASGGAPTVWTLHLNQQGFFVGMKNGVSFETGEAPHTIRSQMVRLLSRINSVHAAYEFVCQVRWEGSALKPLKYV